MSLQLIFGRAGTGKSKYCFDEIKKHIKDKNKIYLITPEQFSYMQEKRLLETIESKASVNAEIITFNRMADRINIEVGGERQPLLTKSSKAMLIYSILQEQKKNFTFLGKSKDNLDLAIKTITEFKKHNVQITDLEENILQVEDINLKLKLQDMTKIYKEYDEKIKNEYIDEDDKLTKLAKNVIESSMFEDSYVYIDEFAGFTAQEYEVLKQIMKKAKKVVVTSCIDLKNETADIFYPNKMVIDKIVKIAKDAKIKIEEPIILDNSYRFKNQELKHLEENIYENKYKVYNKEPNNLYLFLANNPYSEIEYVAKQIVKLVRDENYDYKDIAVITKNIDGVSSLARAIFLKYNIPLYMDNKDELSQNIGVKYILSVLEIFAKKWSCEAVLNYIKLGFSALEKEEIYTLENYAKKWGIKGSKWYKADWNFEENNINELRKKIVEPLLKFKEELNKQKNVKEITKAIYSFLEQNNFYEKINKKIEILEKNQELKLASDYKLSVENLINVLDEIVLLFQETKINFEQYKEILNIGLRYKELGSIPQTIDQVIIGDVDRSRTHKVKVAFIIGMNDGVFPSVNKNEGFFNDLDRETLKSFGTELAKGSIEMLYDEEYNIYKAMTVAEEKLFLSYTSSDKEGSSLRSSTLIIKLKKIFPKLQEASDVTKNITEISSPESTFNDLLFNIRNYQNGDKIDEKWFEVYNWYAKNDIWSDKLQEALKGLKYTNDAEQINKQNIDKLYGDTLKASVSKLEKYQECAFSFHLKYGLNLKEADEFKIKSIDTGNFMHEVVDTFFEENQDIKNITKEEIKTIVARIIEEKLNLKKNAIFSSTAKFIVLTNRLKKVITESICYIVEQMQNSNFEVLGNEIEFNKKVDNLEIVGKIDRVDIAENEEAGFIRIIDYKSSSKNLDLNNMVSGLQIQLLTYVDIISKKTKKEPAGMLYFNLIEPIVSKNKNLSDEEIEEEIRKAFKMKGLILADLKVIKMMDNKLNTGSSNSIPVTLDKSGSIINSRSSVLTKEEFVLLQNKIRSLIKQISKEILSGNIEIKPIYNVKQKKTACEYCPYKTICSFNPKKNMYEYVANRTKDEIFEELKKEI